MSNKGWILAGIVFLMLLCGCLACGVVFGPGFAQGFQRGYRNAMATATARSHDVGPPISDSGTSQHPLPRPSTPPHPSSPSDAVPPTALHVRFEVDEPRYVDTPFYVRIHVEGTPPAHVHSIAFRDDLPMLLTRPVSPKPLEYGTEYPNGRRIFVARYPGIPTPATFTFEFEAFTSGVWSGDVVVCVSPQVSPDTCGVLPLVVSVP